MKLFKQSLFLLLLLLFIFGSFRGVSRRNYQILIRKDKRSNAAFM